MWKTDLFVPEMIATVHRSPTVPSPHSKKKFKFHQIENTNIKCLNGFWVTDRHQSAFITLGTFTQYPIEIQGKHEQIQT